MRHETLPPDHLFGRRMEMLTLAVLSQLRARANWHRIAREWLYGDAPADRARAAQEAEFYARAPRVSASTGAAGCGPKLVAMVTVALLRSSSCSRRRCALGRASVRDRVDELRRRRPDRLHRRLVVLTVRAVSRARCSRARAGLLFGTALGTPVGARRGDAGGVLAFSIARWVAHDAVEELAGPRVRGGTRWVGAAASSRSCTRASRPAMPYNVVNYVAGLTRVPLRVFAAATAIGTRPADVRLRRARRLVRRLRLEPGGDHRGRRARR